MKRVLKNSTIVFSASLIFSAILFISFIYITVDRVENPESYDNFIQTIDSIDSLERWSLERVDNRHQNNWSLSISLESGTSLYFEEVETIEEVLNQLNEALEYLEKE